MENVWILGGLRSFIGVKDGIYRHIPAEVLGAQVLKEIKNRFSLKDEEIDYIIGGNAVAGGGNITRLAALTAGLDEMIPAVTLDLQCGSALESITAAAAKIESGLADLVIAGGFESSSTQPVRMWSGSLRKETPRACSCAQVLRTSSTSNQMVGFASGNRVLSFKMIAGSSLPTQ